MAENLKTTKYRDGSLILTTTPATFGIADEDTPEYQWAYDGNENNATTYGRLYTWYAATDSLNICPKGWHVPLDEEWTILSDFLGGVDNAGGKLKETFTAHWSNPNTGASNETGFTALPSGIKELDGTFYGMGEIGYWWTSTASAVSFAWGRSLYSGYILLDRAEYLDVYGFSVRCVKDQPKTEEAFPVIHGELLDFIIYGDTITVDKINDK
jgi:uncharacterized protein (TIGR02145 family)